jgi:hypothetical protein
MFLVVTNIATILTVVRHIRNQEDGAGTELKQNGSKDKNSPVDLPDTQRTLFFTKALMLDSDQQSAFREVNWNYGRQTRKISEAMSQLREQLLNALDQQEPDTALLNNLSDQIGRKHTELKKLTITYYLGLKSICNTDQKKALFNMFQKLLSPESNVNVPTGMPQGRGPKGTGQGQGQGPGQGRGPWWKNQKDSISSK